MLHAMGVRTSPRWLIEGGRPTLTIAKIRPIRMRSTTFTTGRNCQRFIARFRMGWSPRKRVTTVISYPRLGCCCCRRNGRRPFRPIKVIRVLL